MITKVALITLDTNDNILLLKKKGLEFWILPGGKPEPGESHEACLRRELKEELKINMHNDFYVAFDCHTIAAGTNTPLHLYLYFGHLFRHHRITPSQEIEYAVWVDPCQLDKIPVTDSLRQQVLPWVIGLLKNKHGLSHVEPQYRTPQIDHRIKQNG